MVAINYAKDIRVGGQSVKAAALGSYFVWPPLPERLFFRGQSLTYDFAKQRYGTRLPDDTIDYTTNVNDLGIVTRASTATYWGPEGSLLEAATDEARIQHDPETGKALGVLVEGSATNLVPYSESPGSWNSVEADISPRVDGGTTVSSGVVTTPTRRGIHDVSPVAIATPNTQHTKTIIVENISAGIMWVGAHWGFNNFARQVGMVMDFTDMSVKYVGPSVLSYKVEPVGGEKYSITITSDLLENTNTLGLYFLSGAVNNYLILDNVLNIVTDVAREFVFHRAQREIGSFPTSYIPTSGSPVTRAADNAVIDLSDVWTPTSGTMIVEATVYETVNGQYGAVFLGGDSGSQSFGNNAFGFYVDSGAMNFGFQARNLVGEFFNLPGFVLGQPFKMAMSWSVGDNLVIAAQGASSTTRTEVTSGQNLVEMVLLSRAGKFSNGVVKQLLYFPRALSAAELEALTAL